MLEFDNSKSPLIGIEYVVRFKSNIIDQFVCILCNKKGNSENLLNHLKSKKHRMNFLHDHFPIIAKELTRIQFDVKKSSHFVSHLVEKAFGRREITICDHEYSDHSSVRNRIYRMSKVFYAEEDLKVERIVNFLKEYENNESSSKNKIREHFRNNKGYVVKKKKLDNFRISLKFAFDTLDLKHKYYTKYPTDHPEYAAELSSYKLKMISKVRNMPGKNPTTHDHTVGWKKHWDKTMDESFMKEEHYMKEEIIKQFNLPFDKKQKPSSSIKKHKPARDTAKSSHKRSCEKHVESIPAKRIKISKDKIIPALDVEKVTEHDDPTTLLSICKQLKSYVLGDLTVKISNLFDDASKSCKGDNLDVLQDFRNVKLLENVKLILIDQTADNWLPASKTNEMRQVIKHITLLLKKFQNPPPTTQQSYEILSEEDIKMLVLNYSELSSNDQNDLVYYFEIMKVKNNEFYKKITNIIKQEISPSAKKESSFVVDEVNDVSIVITDDDDDYDLTEVVLKAKQIVEENSCDSEVTTKEIPTYEISSDDN